MTKLSNKDSEFIDIHALLASYRQHWWWFVVSAVLCVAGAYFYGKIKPDTYVVRANVIISDDNTGSLTSMSGFSDLFGSSANVEDEVFVVTSHTVLRDVVRELGLNERHYVKKGFMQTVFEYTGYPIEVYAPAGISDTLRTGLGFTVKLNKEGLADIEVKKGKDVMVEMEDAKLPATLNTPYGRFVVDRTKECPRGKAIKSFITIGGYNGAAEDLSHEVSSDKAAKKSNMVALSIKTPNPEYGEAVLNAIVKQYNLRGVEESSKQGENTLEFIDRRLGLISGDLATAEGDIEGYKQAHGIVDVGVEANYNMAARGEAERELVKAETETEIIKMTRDFLTQPENAYQLIPASAEIPGASSAIGTYNALIIQRMQLMENAKGNNRALRQLDEQIDAMRASINTTLARAYQTSLLTVSEARQHVNKVMGKLGNVPAQEREFLNLKRQQEVKQQIYLFLLQRREETAVMVANALPKGRIVDEAYTLSKPIGMGRKLMMLIALVLGLCIPPAILAVKKMLRNRFETVDDVKGITDVPVLGEVCTDPQKRTLAVSANDVSGTAELFRALRTRLGFILGPDKKVVLVTSTRSGEGKSFISANFAATLALAGKRVALVGMDIRNPRLAEYLGLNNGRGVTSYLSDPGAFPVASLEQKVPSIPGLSVIVAGPIPPNPGELLGSQALKSLVDTLRNDFDYIIIDSAPVGMVSDTFNLEKLVDATVYVCRANYTTFTDMNFVTQLYADKRLPGMALVVNGTKTSKGYGYGYGKKSKN